MFLSPNETIEKLGTKEDFERANQDKNAFEDEEHNELLNEKLNQEYQDEMRSLEQ